MNPTAPRHAPVDVYAFSIVMLEIMTGQPAYGSMRADEIRAVVGSGQRPGIPESVPTDLTKLIRFCWAQNPNDRPGFEQVVEMLDCIASNICTSVTATSTCADTTTML